MRFAEKCLPLALPALARASTDTMSLEDALAVQVEGASRFMQPLSDAPADVTVTPRRTSGASAALPSDDRQLPLRWQTGF